MAIIVTIGGNTVGIAMGWSISTTVNNRSTFSCGIPSTDASYIPALDDEIVVTDGGTRIFAGYVRTTIVTAAIDSRVAILTAVEGIDYNSLIDRVYWSVVIQSGTLKAALQTLLVPLNTRYGVTLDGAQVDGPYLPLLDWSQTVKLADAFNNLATLSGYYWEIDFNKVLRMVLPGASAAPFNLSDSDDYAVGDISVMKTRAHAGTQAFANRVLLYAGMPEAPISVVAEDVGDQALHTIWETAIRSTNVFDGTTAQALANAYLLQCLLSPRTVVYETYQSGLAPGQSQTIVRTTRGLNGVFLITDVQKRDYEGHVRCTVTALDVSVPQTTWQNMYQQWTSGTQISQLATVNGGVGGGGGGSVYFLGGSATEYVQSAGPTWIPVDGVSSDPGVQVIIDTAIHSSISLKVTARLRATAGTVTARLRNLSDSVTVGTSVVVSQTTFQTVIFYCTLTAGAKTYQLELLPSLANTDVSGVGYAE